MRRKSPLLPFLPSFPPTKPTVRHRFFNRSPLSSSIDSTPTPLPNSQDRIVDEAGATAILNLQSDTCFDALQVWRRPAVRAPRASKHGLHITALHGAQHCTVLL